MPGESIHDRLATLSRAELIALVAVVGVTVAGAGFWYVRSLPAPVQVRSGPSGALVAAPTASVSPATVILVDVAGWVRRPGVYEFAEGARVIDAIDAAGGARPGAVLSSLNLAAPLVDGTQVLVPKESQSAPTTETETGTSGATGLVNVNSATNAELETLPGIGEVLAQAIVDHRTENGPFTSVEQLVDVSGIGDATLENIRELVTV
ncbi:MAG TPA: ComEA family DNA-binding protein [Actinomycetota bacterium]|nr:ComEA family DNA-binding protein [Actinomycetota bacterium]